MHQHQATTPCTQPDQIGLELGDFGYRHCQYHKGGYERVFEQIQRCKCHDGGCRPTTIKSDPNDPSVLFALIDRQWVKIDKKIIVLERELDRETKSVLFPDGDQVEAHVCALPRRPLDPECLIPKPAGI